MARKNVIKFPCKFTQAVRQPQPAEIVVLPIIRIERCDARTFVRKTLARADTLLARDKTDG